MYLPLLAGVALFVGTALASRQILQGALTHLSEADQAKLVERIRASRSPTGLFIYMGFVGLWLWAFLTLPEHARTVHFAFIGAVFALLAAFVARSHRRTEALPADFRRAMLRASIVRAAGFAALLVGVAWPLVSRA